jgi:hypothetical protein
MSDEEEAKTWTTKCGGEEEKQSATGRASLIKKFLITHSQKIILRAHDFS